MSATVQAIYENGLLRPLTPLSLPEHTVVRMQVEPLTSDGERVEWLGQRERRLFEVWNNEADDVYNALLAE